MVVKRRPAALLSLALCLIWPGTSQGQYLTDAVASRHLARTDPFEWGRLIRTPQTLQNGDFHQPFGVRLAHLAGTDPFESGRVIRNPQTLEVEDFQELFRKTAGKVRHEKVLKYGSFEYYWAASSSSRTGKAFEAIEAWRANEVLAQSGSSERVLVSAVEGQTKASADLVKINSEGQVIERYQLKLGRKAAVNALRDPKYQNMKIVVPRDVLESLKRELEEQKIKAAQRGVPLKPDWQVVDDALREGRLTDEIVTGVKTSTTQEIEELAMQATEKEWQAAAAELGGEAVESAGAARIKTRIIKIGGRIMLIVGVVYVACETYREIGAYRRGEIGGDVLAAKLVLHAGGVSTLIWAWAVADPEPFTKLILFVTGVGIGAADVWLDYYAEVERERTRNLLEKIDYDERFFAVRRQLLQELRTLSE